MHAPDPMWRAMSVIAGDPHRFARAASFVTWAARGALRAYILENTRLASDITQLSADVGAEAVTQALESLNDEEAGALLTRLDPSAAKHLSGERARLRLITYARRDATANPAFAPESTSLAQAKAPMPNFLRTLRKHAAFGARRLQFRGASRTSGSC